MIYSTRSAWTDRTPWLAHGRVPPLSSERDTEREIGSPEWPHRREEKQTRQGLDGCEPLMDTEVWDGRCDPASVNRVWVVFGGFPDLHTIAPFHWSNAAFGEVSRKPKRAQ